MVRSPSRQLSCLVVLYLSLSAVSIVHAEDGEAGGATLPESAVSAPETVQPPRQVDAPVAAAAARPHRPVVVGRTASSTAPAPGSTGPLLWSPHREQPVRTPFEHERWFLELGLGVAPRVEDVFVQRLERTQARDNSTSVGPQLAFGAAVHRNLTLVSRYDLLGVNKYDSYRWRTHAVSAGLRGVLNLSQVFQMFGEVDLGIALARVETRAEVPDDVPWDAEQPSPTKVYEQELGPMVRVAAGLTVGGERVGAYLAATYVHATALRDFDAVHNDGGLGFSGGIRVRGLHW